MMATVKFRGKVLATPAGIEVGPNANRVAEILCGSVSGCYDAVASSAVSDASFIVTGMTTAHKVYATVYSATDSCNLTMNRVVPGTDVITASFANIVGTDIALEGTATIHYIAVLDK
jgi:hypothetical protein